MEDSKTSDNLHQDRMPPQLCPDMLEGPAIGQKKSQRTAKKPLYPKPERIG